MRRCWYFLPLPFLALGAAWWGVLLIPGPVELELYDVGSDGLVYSLWDTPSVDISLATHPEPYYPPMMTGMELAGRIEGLLPESRDKNADEMVVFTNELIVVRATPIKQAAVRAIIGLHKTRNRVLVALHSHDSEIKAAFETCLRRIR